MSKKVPCVFISVWGGGMEVDSPAMFDSETGIVSDVQLAPMPESVLHGLGVLDRELVRVDDKEYELRRNEDGTYSTIRTFEVFFSRNGYAEVRAASAEEALRIADEEVKYDDVSWDDDWHPTDAQLEE